MLKVLLLRHILSVFSYHQRLGHQFLVSENMLVIAKGLSKSLKYNEFNKMNKKSELKVGNRRWKD